jgi:hypothetical protein
MATQPKMPQPEGLSLDVFYNADRLKAMGAYGESIVASGEFPKSIANKFQAIAIMQAGAEMGMAPMEAIGSFYIVNGKVSMYGVAVTRQLRKHGWKIAFKDEVPGKKVTVVITKGEESYEYTADEKDPVLQRSTAMKNDPWSKIRWHALSRVLRFNVPEVMSAAPYMAEEMEDFVDVEVAEVPKRMRVKKAFDQEVAQEPSVADNGAAQEPGQPVVDAAQTSIDVETGEIAEPTKPEAQPTQTSKIPPLQF